ncbi:MAG: hypothetical protein M1831_002125 [Alyxoria varia]|nr:MAG: hypothetical protein M1831_002125 [Alyxoria varia]
MNWFSRSLPPELTIQVFSNLDSFHDVLALAAVNKRLHATWTENVPQIYRALAPRCVPCEKYARQTLADQEQSSGLVTTPEDVKTLMDNAQAVERGMVRLEEEVIPTIDVRGFDTQKYYGADSHCHPSELTAGERRRFRRTYYLLWSLMLVSPEQRNSRIEQLPLKHLYLVYAFIHPEHYAAPIGLDHTAWRGIDANRFQDIIVELRDMVTHRADQIHEMQGHRTAMESGFARMFFESAKFRALWDHWQDILRARCESRWFAEDPDSIDGQGEIGALAWVDSEDEDFCTGPELGLRLEDLAISTSGD